MFTDSLWVRAHGTMLEVDIMYMHKIKGCPCRMCDLTGELWTDPKRWNLRLMLLIFKCKMTSHPDYGLPYYRFWFMDPSMRSVCFLCSMLLPFEAKVKIPQKIPGVLPRD